jgi:hypothetical protein
VRALLQRVVPRALWLWLLGRGYRGHMVEADRTASRGRHLEPIRLSELMHECPGKWVALRNGEIIEVRETFDAVVFALHEQGITDATILRSPEEHESELVGLG